MNEEEFSENRESYSGYCRKCNEITNWDGVEPDAEKYNCVECNQPKVYGIEQALLYGWIRICT